MSRLKALALVLSLATLTGCGDSAPRTDSTQVGPTAATVERSAPTVSVTTLPAPTTSGRLTTVAATVATTATAPLELNGATIGQIAGATQHLLDDRWDADPNKPEGVLGAFEIVCADLSATAVKGDAFACAGVPRTEPDFHLDPVGVVFVVLDDRGGVAFTSGTDLPDSTATLEDIYESSAGGLLCRDLADDATAGYFSTCCGTPGGNYFRAVLYWFLEGMPDRMDADRNGIPCETVFPSEVVDAIWAGGPVG